MKRSSNISAIKGRIKQHSAFRWAAKLIHDSTVVKSSSRRNEGQFYSSLNSCMTINISSNRLFQQRSSVPRLILASSFSSATRSFFNGSRRAAHACLEYCSRVNILAGREKRKRHAYLLIIDPSSLIFMLSRIL